MHDDTPADRPPVAKTDAIQPLSEAELSRIARQAVHQPADARLDKQLVRLGLMDPAESPETQATQAGRPVAVDPELERLREQLRRARLHEWLLVGVIAVLTVVMIVLLLVR